MVAMTILDGSQEWVTKVTHNFKYKTLHTLPVEILTPKVGFPFSILQKNIIIMLTAATHNTPNALIPYQGRPTHAVEQIMKRVVADKSNTSYRNNNIILMLWLYDNEEMREEVLRDWMVDRLNRATSSDEATNATRRGRPAVRAECRKAIDNINKADQNCPILLNKLTFNVFSHYITTRKNKKGEYLSKAGYGQIRSSLKHLYRMSGETMSEEYEKDLSQLMSGLKRTVAAEKGVSGRDLDEGKKGMSFEVYKRMCEILFKSDDDDYLFAHAFLTMEWNLLARSDNCFSMRTQHVEFKNDSLIFFFAKSKGNQLGEASEKPWHVYSNPRNPFLCPVLALARYVVSNPDILKNRGLLFPGQHQYTRFMNIFHKVIRENKELFEANGVREGDLGSHSCRKGAITLVSAGCTVSPPMAAICLRAGWSMGPVKDRYIHYEKARDQFVGRCATGISSLGKDFATSPVYWDMKGAPVGMKGVIDKCICNNFGTIDELEGKTFELIRFLFASICYHYDTLDTHLHPEHKMRSSPLFIAASQGDLQRHAVVSFPWNATEDTPFFTGIPPHVMMLTELESLRLRLVEHRNDIIDGFKDELDKRSLGGADYQTRVIMDEVKKSHDEMIRRMEGLKMSATTENVMGQLNSNDEFFFINDEDDSIDEVEDERVREESGVGQHNNEAGQREEVGQQNNTLPHAIQYDSDNYPASYIEDNYTDVSRSESTDSLETPRPPTPPLELPALEIPATPPQTLPPNTSRRRGIANGKKGKGIIISWQNVSNGNLRLVSKNFTFPKMSFPNMLCMWYCGDISKNIPPYRLLKACDVLGVKGGKQKLSNMRCLVRHVERAARMVNMPHLILKKWDARGVLDLHNATKHVFAFPSLVGGKQERRFEQLNWKTFYNILAKRKGRLYGEVIE